jgi:hypothetical protein
MPDQFNFLLARVHWKNLDNNFELAQSSRSTMIEDSSSQWLEGSERSGLQAP